MAMKVLKSEGNELRIRITEEDYTSLQLFRIRLNAHSDVDYANFFTGHPDLDEPELYIRVKKGKNAVKVLKSVCSTIDKDFGSLSL